jgi:hypothetical protein
MSVAVVLSTLAQHNVVSVRQKAIFLKKFIKMITFRGNFLKTLTFFLKSLFVIMHKLQVATLLTDLSEVEGLPVATNNIASKPTYNRRELTKKSFAPADRVRLTGSIEWISASVGPVSRPYLTELSDLSKGTPNYPRGALGLKNMGIELLTECSVAWVIIDKKTRLLSKEWGLDPIE